MPGLSFSRVFLQIPLHHVLNVTLVDEKSAGENDGINLVPVRVRGELLIRPDFVQYS